MATNVILQYHEPTPCRPLAGVTKLANLPSNELMKTTSISNAWVLVLGIVLVCELAGQAQVVSNPDPGPAPTLMGTVFDPSGSAVLGTELVVAQVIKSRSVGVRGPSKVSKSDAQGKFAITWQSLDLGPSLPPRSSGYWLIGRDLAHGFAAAVKFDWNFRGVVTMVDLHLRPGFTLSGSVQDSKGAALKTAMAQLYMRPEDGSRSTSPDWDIPTDGLGNFSFTALPTGYDYRLRVMTPGYGSTNLSVSAAQTQTARLKLPTIMLKSADQWLEGVVLDVDGKPIAKSQVQLIGVEQFPQTTNTDANGHFIFSGVSDGRVAVYADNPNIIIEGGLHPRGGGASARAGDLNVVVQFRAPRGGSPPSGPVGPGTNGLP